MLKENSRLTQIALRGLDIIAVLGGAFLAFLLRFGETKLPMQYGGAILLGVLLGMLGFALCGVYEPLRGQRLRSHLKALLMSWILLGGVLTGCAFFTKTGAQFSRVWLSEWMVIGFLLNAAFRSFLYLALGWLRKKGVNIRRVLVVGSGELLSKTLSALEQEKWAGYVVSKHLSGDEIPENFEYWLEVQSIDEVWLAIPFSDQAKIQSWLHQLRFSTVNIHLVPDIFGWALLNQSLFELAGLPVIKLRASPMQGLNQAIKWVEDKLIALGILILISPLMLVLAILVKLSSKGPVFYKQERVSWNNRRFMMLKFRSMPVNVEAQTGPVWARPNEQRATAIGAFLRKTSLDELPQFLNVLKGDMSIVGPRPERPLFVEQFKEQIPGYMQKHMVKAGITGWAQVNGWRGSTDLHKRIEYDLYYIQHWSVWFDLKIIFLTVLKGFFNRNAY